MNLGLFDSFWAGAGAGSIPVLLFAPRATINARTVAVVAFEGPGRKRRKRRTATIDDESLPEAVVLLKLALVSGLSVAHAIAAVGAAIGGPVGELLVGCHRRCEQGVPIGDAIRSMRERLPPYADPLVTVLLSAVDDGGSIGASFDVLAADFREQRRRRAEMRARRVPVLLLFPLVFCLLPAFVLLALVPLLLGAFGGIAF